VPSILDNAHVLSNPKLLVANTLRNHYEPV
jgi:hypothetical protein